MLPSHFGDRAIWPWTHPWFIEEGLAASLWPVLVTRIFDEVGASAHHIADERGLRSASQGAEC